MNGMLPRGPFGHTFNLGKNFGPRAFTKDVRVKFRERAGDLLDAKNLPLYVEQVSVRRMKPAEYFEWIDLKLESKQVQLVSVELVED